MNQFKFAVAVIFIAGCAGSDVDDTRGYSGSPFGTDASSGGVPVAGDTECTTVEGARPADDCLAGQLVVVRCTGEIENPDRERCGGQRSKPAQVSGSVWCCELEVQ